MPHSLEQAERNIGLYVISNKAEFMCFNEDGVISSLEIRMPVYMPR